MSEHSREEQGTQNEFQPGDKVKWVLGAFDRPTIKAVGPGRFGDHEFPVVSVEPDRQVRAFVVALGTHLRRFGPAPAWDRLMFGPAHPQLVTIAVKVIDPATGQEGTREVAFSGCYFEKV